MDWTINCTSSLNSQECHGDSYSSKQLLCEQYDSVQPHYLVAMPLELVGVPKTQWVEQIDIEGIKWPTSFHPGVCGWELHNRGQPKVQLFTALSKRYDTSLRSSLFTFQMAFSFPSQLTTLLPFPLH